MTGGDAAAVRRMLAAKTWAVVGCSDDPRRTSYAIAEFLQPTPEIERLIFSHAEHSAIERAAVAAGMVTLFDAGLDAALAGQTTIEEVVRSVRAEV